MFMFHAAYSLGLISLTAGTALYLWSANSNYGGGLAKIIGIIVIIASIGSTLCTTYYGIKYWQQGAFENAMGMCPMMQMQDKSMNGGMQMQGGSMMDGKEMPSTDQHKR